MQGKSSLQYYFLRRVRPRRVRATIGPETAAAVRRAQSITGQPLRRARTSAGCCAAVDPRQRRARDHWSVVSTDGPPIAVRGIPATDSTYEVRVLLYYIYTLPDYETFVYTAYAVTAVVVYWYNIIINNMCDVHYKTRGGGPPNTHTRSPRATSIKLSVIFVYTYIIV